MIGNAPDPAARSISISAGQVADLSAAYSRQTGRPPTDAELDNLVQRLVREEVLYREALRLGLDRDDTVVRRRMAQKMDLLASARAETAEPSVATLKQWHSEHADRFRDPARYSIDQLRYGEIEAARTALRRLERGADWKDESQQFDLPRSTRSMPRDELLDRFGIQFANELDRLDAGPQWQGPIPSGLGWHLVRVNQREEGKLLPLEAIEEKVANDWRAATIAERKEEAYRILREAYRVEIDK